MFKLFMNKISWFVPKVKLLFKCDKKICTKLFSNSILTHFLLIFYLFCFILLHIFTNLHAFYLFIP